MSQTDSYTDVVELCALLQCLGFSVKSLENHDGNISQENGTRTVVINCQSSGLRVILESASLSCSCPSTTAQASGIWEVAGVTGGKQIDKEIGCSLLASLPKSHRDRLNKDLRDMIRSIKDHNDSVEIPKNKETLGNRSSTTLDLKTPEKILYDLKCDTPTRYRSLDTLTNKKQGTDEIPPPGPLQKSHVITEPAEEDKMVTSRLGRRQSTYTLTSTPGSVKLRNKTSSPINALKYTLLEDLTGAERAITECQTKLANVIRDLEEGKHDSFLSLNTLDVSKISILKAAEPFKAQCASSPNLSTRGSAHEDFLKSKLKRLDSASTSNLAPKAGSKISRLRRLSPFSSSKGTPSSLIKSEKAKTENKSRLSGLFGSKASPAPKASTSAKPSPNLSANNRKFSQIKSSIPRGAKKE
ncbi:hypothetical protein K1T71_009920 [Dendrolimus kikuchii]|uniref:Uncharacterized protein n=1 Tax=Dendrolimus kikuchii TaxID=765133 RepID=A0ACC1CT73_9NEOP|nr:hypothetical protein K1T71_009920 [Dendrolimus kikuchii]